MSLIFSYMKAVDYYNGVRKRTIMYYYLYRANIGTSFDERNEALKFYHEWVKTKITLLILITRVGSFYFFTTLALI